MGCHSARVPRRGDRAHPLVGLPARHARLALRDHLDDYRNLVDATSPLPLRASKPPHWRGAILYDRMQHDDNDSPVLLLY